VLTNFAVGLGAASGFGNANKIALVANGDVTVNKNAKLTAVDTTISTGSSNQGAEGFNMGGVASSVTGTVYIRPDANDNDYGQVYLNGSYTKLSRLLLMLLIFITMLLLKVLLQLMIMFYITKKTMLTMAVKNGAI
jgi:hypothetical protein